MKKTPLGPSIVLHRSLRQRYYSHLTASGQTKVIHKPDFPLYADAYAFDDWSLAEIEEWERGKWKKGADVEWMDQDALQITNDNLSGGI